MNFTEVLEIDSTKGEYLYRYISIDKLCDFLKNNSIYLSRIDRFEDNLEGADFETILALTLKNLKNHKLPLDIETYHLSEYGYNQSLKKIKIIQKKYFASCWFQDKSESMAMWDLYGKNGFVIKFKLNDFIEYVRESSKNTLIKKITLGCITYEDFNTIQTGSALKIKEVKRFYTKHSAFNYENEFRAIATLNEANTKKNYLRLKLPVDIKFEVFSNPRMSDLEYQIYELYIKKNYNRNIQESTIKNILNYRESKF